MVFKARTKTGETDPDINVNGRPKVDKTKKLTRREIKEKEFLSLARKIRPHVAASIAAAVGIIKAGGSTDTNKLKAAAFLVTEYQKLIKETYSMEGDSDTEESVPEEVQGKSTATVFSLKMVGDEDDE